MASNVIEQLFNQLMSTAKSVGVDKQDQRALTEMEKNLRHSIVRSDLSEHDGMKDFIAYIRQEIADINKVLIEKRDLKEEDRKLLFYKRDWNDWLLSFFTRAKSNLGRAENTIKRQTAHLKTFKTK